MKARTDAELLQNLADSNYISIEERHAIRRTVRRVELLEKVYRDATALVEALEDELIWGSAKKSVREQVMFKVIRVLQLVPKAR